LDIKVNESGNIRRELSAEISYDELIPHFNKAFIEFRKKATHPGFRKGKMPLDMVKKLYGDSIEYSSLEDIAADIFRDYIIENNIELAGKGEIKDLNYDPKKNLKFKINFEVFPDLKVENYKNLELKQIKYKIDDSLIDEEIKYHRFRNAGFEIDGIASDDNYIITVDLQNLDESGNILIGQNQKDLKIYLGNEEIYPEFKKAFKGIKEGEVKVIDSTNAEGNAKKVQITCNKVEKIIYPELDEKFFLKITGKDTIKTEDEFREEIRDALSKIYNSISERKLRDDVISELVKLNDVEIPGSYIENILNTITDNYLEQNKSKKLPANFSESEFKKEKRADAIFSGKWHLIREKLIKMENITIEEEDYKKIADENASQYNIPAEKLLEVYKENEDVKAKILNDKLIDRIISYAEIEVKEELKTKVNSAEEIS